MVTHLSIRSLYCFSTTLYLSCMHTNSSCSACCSSFSICKHKPTYYRTTVQLRQLQYGAITWQIILKKNISRWLWEQHCRFHVIESYFEPISENVKRLTPVSQSVMPSGFSLESSGQVIHQTLVSQLKEIARPFTGSFIVTSHVHVHVYVCINYQLRENYVSKVKQGLAT